MRLAEPLGPMDRLNEIGELVPEPEEDIGVAVLLEVRAATGLS